MAVKEKLGLNTGNFDRQGGHATRDLCHNSEGKFSRRSGGTGVGKFLKWGRILGVELRVASHKHGEAQSNFPVSIRTAGMRDGAQCEAGTGHTGQEVTFLVSVQWEGAPECRL